MAARRNRSCACAHHIDMGNYWTNSTHAGRRLGTCNPIATTCNQPFSSVLARSKAWRWHQSQRRIRSATSKSETLAEPDSLGVRSSPDTIFDALAAGVVAIAGDVGGAITVRAASGKTGLKPDGLSALGFKMSSVLALCDCAGVRSLVPRLSEGRFTGLLERGFLAPRSPRA